MDILMKKISGNVGKNKKKPIEPTEIFTSLIHAEGHDYLRDVQKEFLKEWHSRRVDRDIIGKLNTGAGKTLIGLLMLQSKINEGVGPALYLCPDNQLVSQVLDQASLHDFRVVTLPKSDGNERVEFPVEFLNGQSILVTTFERVFNGKSIFGVDGYGSREVIEIGAMVIDDAHTCIKKARAQCTITIDDTHPSYNKIFEIFEEDLEYQGAGQLSAIKMGHSSVCKMVPYWSWNNKFNHVSNIVEELYENNDPSVFYSWGLIGDELKDNCECYISGTKIEITPTQIPFEKIPSFNEANFRYILSATFANDSELVRELGISKESILNPIQVENKGDAGERLIVAPRRYFNELDDNFMRKFISEYSSEHNVVVLVPGSIEAKKWEQLGAEVVNKDNILESTKKLKNSRGNLMVFLNRYDGIDLEGDSCHILVLDGLPSAQSLRNQYYGTVREGSISHNTQVAQTIEQGLGRSVRSGTDYSVVFVLNNSLLNFISIKRNQELFAPATREQLEFGLELFNDEQPSSMEMAMNEISKAIEICLSRNKDWREFHKNLILDAPSIALNSTESLIEVADIEKRALKLFRNGDAIKSAELILEYVDSEDFKFGALEKAWYFQFCSRLLNKVQPSKSEDLQIKAREMSPRMLKPINHKYSKLTSSRGVQAEILSKWMKQFGNGNDINIYIESMLSNLVFSQEISSNSFEESIKEVGLFLGFSSQRPEEDIGDGPDNLWKLENGLNIIIEVKNRSTNEEMSRSDIEQLLHSIEWHKDKYGEEQEYIPIIIHRSSKCSNGVYPSENTRVIDKDKLSQLKEQIKNFGNALSQKSPNSWTSIEINELLSSYYLNYNLIIEKFTKIPD